MIKKITILLTLSCALSGCLTNEDGSDAFTYSSCRITGTSSLDAKEREVDLARCWDATGSGYVALDSALQWCKNEVDAYSLSRYHEIRTMTFDIDTTYCK